MSCFGRLASKAMKDEKFFTTIGSYFWTSLIIIMGCYILWVYDIRGAQGDDVFFNHFEESVSSEMDAPSWYQPVHYSPTVKKENEEIVHNNGFMLSINKNATFPNWVCWKLSASEAIASKLHHQLRGDKNDSTDEGVDMVNSSDMYEEIRLCPAAAFTDTYKKGNICPMHKGVTPSWKQLEQYSRFWAMEYGEIYIYAGCLMDEATAKSERPIPTAYFKAIVRLGKKPAGLGFLFPNHAGTTGYSPCCLSIAELENLCGHVFCEDLPPATLPTIKSSADMEEWQAMPDNYY